MDKLFSQIAFLLLGIWKSRTTWIQELGKFADLLKWLRLAKVISIEWLAGCPQRDTDIMSDRLQIIPTPVKIDCNRTLQKFYNKEGAMRDNVFTKFVGMDVHQKSISIAIRKHPKVEYLEALTIFVVAMLAFSDQSLKPLLRS